MVKKTEYFLNDIGVKGIVANNSVGAAGEVLASNGSSTYWTSPSSGPTGYTGSQGSIGFTGSQGSIGYTGSKGTADWEDNRIIAPNEVAVSQFKFGFTSWNNDNASPYADFFHIKSYSDLSGGDDNLLAIKKTGFGLRQWQQTYDSATPYSSFVDFWHTGNDGSGSGLDADTLDGIHAIGLFNNMGYAHGAHTDFNSLPNYGPGYVQGTANGPGISGANQYYVQSYGLGTTYAYSDFAMQTAIPRTAEGGNPYLSVRYRESGVWSSWSKIHAGYADNADLLDGIDITRIVYGDSANKTTTLSDANTELPSGFYDGFDAANAPATNWFNYIMMRHSNVANHFGHQIAADFYSNNLWNRNVAGGVWSSWSKIWNSANDGSGSGLDADTVDGIHASALVAKFTGVADGVDLNTLTDSGFYRFGATVVNGPSGYTGYSNMLAISGADTMTQIWSDYATPNMWTRKGPGVTSGAWSAPSAWYMMWNSGNDGSGSGLDADLLDGYNATTTTGANTIPVRDASGYVFLNYINSNTADNENPTIGQIITTGGDNYYRKSSITHVRNSMLVQGAWINDNGGNNRIFFGTGERIYLKSASNTGTSLELRRLDDTTMFTVDVSGNFTATGNVTAYSDINLKDNIQTIRESLEKVCAMRGVTFNRKSDGSASSGVVAQELELIAPELIHENENGVKSVAYGNLVGYLIEAVKELKNKVDNQELIISQFRMLR